jgi:hypothetical protein
MPPTQLEVQLTERRLVSAKREPEAVRRGVDRKH